MQTLPKGIIQVLRQFERLFKRVWEWSKVLLLGPFWLQATAR